MTVIFNREFNPVHFMNDISPGFSPLHFFRLRSNPNQTVNPKEFSAIQTNLEQLMQNSNFTSAATEISVITERALPKVDTAGRLKPAGVLGLRLGARFAALAGVAFLVLLSFGGEVQATTKFWIGSGTLTTANLWSLTTGGPYNQTWVAGDTAVFDVANSTITYVTTVSVGGLTANQNVTWTAAGTLTTAGTVMPISVASGMTLDLAGQNISTVAGTGISKSGAGVLISANGNAYPGGFTLSLGTMVCGGVNAMGAGPLNINGGTIAGSATRNFSGKYASGITVGGNFQLGALVTEIPQSSSVANLTFDNNMAFGASTRTITMGASGTYTLGGIISGSPGVGLTVSALAGTQGALALSGANTYNGGTTVNSGAALSFLNTIAKPGSGTVTVGSGATLGLGVAAASNPFSSANVDSLFANTLSGVSMDANSLVGIDTAGGNFTYSTVVSSTRGLHKLGANNLTLSGVGNNYGGPTKITGTGGLLLGASGVIPDTSVVSLVAGANLTLNGFDETVKSVSGLGGSVILGANTLTINDPAGENFGAGGAGTITGNTGGKIIKNGSGQFSIGGTGGTGAPNYSGGLTLNNGALGIGANASLGTGTFTVNNVSGAVILGNNVIGGRTITAPVTLNGDLTVDDTFITPTPGTITFLTGAWTITGGNRTIKVNTAANNSYTVTINSIIGQDVSGRGLAKTGNGILTLGAANTYSGDTTISAGTLKLSASGTINSSANIVVGSSAILDATAVGISIGSSQTLKGNGTVNGTVTLAAGGTISAGASPGTLTTGNEIWNGGGTNIWEINNTAGSEGADPGWDLLNIAGSLNNLATPSSKFTIKITSLTTGNVAGNAANFDNTQDYVWRIATASGGIIGFDAAAFTLDTSSFSNPVGTGAFLVEKSGNDILLRFVHPPAISIQPISASAECGISNATFSVTATGSAPLSYQWRHAGTNLPGANASFLAFTPATSANAGAYDVVLTNAYGSVTSTPSATLTITDTTPPVFNCGQNETVSCMQGWGFTYPIVTDNCDGIISGNAVPISTTTNFTCGYTFIATRIWQVSDSSANTTYCTQVVTYVDFIPPTITACPTNVTVPCLAAVPAPDISSVTATNQFDPCDTNTPVVVHFSDVTNGVNPIVITRTYRAYDACTNFAQCVQTITVPADTTPPTFTACPAPIVVAAEIGQCSKSNVTFSATATDNCSTNVTVVCTPVSGSTFALGTNMVTCIATDGAGNSNVCSFTVTVVGNALPNVVCPSNIIVSVDAGLCDKTNVTFIVTASDDCNVLTVGCVPPSGSTFPAGTTVVTCTATNGLGNTNSCSFTVTVLETTPPVIAWLADTTAECGYTTPASTGTPTATDNCDPSPAITFVDSSAVEITPSGLGSWATFTAGSPLTATASFVNGPSVPPLGTGSLRLTLGATGSGTSEVNNTDYDTVLLADVTELSYRTYRTVDGATGNKSIYLVLDVDLDGDFIIDDSIIFEPRYQNGSNPGLPLQGALVNGTWQKWNALSGGWWSISGLAGLTSGAGVKPISVYLATYPNARIINSSGSDGGVRLLAGFGFGPSWANFDGAADFFTIGTNGISKSFDFNLVPGNNPCQPVVLRTWTATDSSGNQNSSSQKISVLDTTPPAFSGATNIVVNSTIGACSALVNYTVTASDVCDLMPGLTVNPPSGTVFSNGVWTVNCSATDACGNITNRSFTVTVIDSEAPSINCPSNQVLTADAGQCGKSNVTFLVTASDNCTTVTVVSTAASGSTFPIGVTTVTNVATDGSGNSNVCTFTVTVNDTQLPLITCPVNLVLTADVDQCGKSNVTFLVTASDNCPGVLVVSTPAVGSTFPIGVTTVTNVATDASGNSNVCTFTVTVNDTQAPNVTCPTDLVLAADAGQCGRSNVTYSAIVTDNCAAIPVVVYTPPSGSTFSNGVTTVYCLVTDTSGNTNGCSFTVTVNDTEPPVITVLGANPLTNECHVAFVDPGATANDNCAGMADSPSGTQIYFNGFETNITDWDAFGAPYDATRVPSGNNGITSASGNFHAESSADGSASRWGGYNYGAGNAVPTTFKEYTTSVDIYLNVSGGWINDTRFDFDSAINNAAGTFNRDFIFNAGFYNDADASPGSGTSRFVISASNNSQPGSAFAKNPGNAPIAIATSGWYTFKHHFYDNAGVLAVDMSIFDSSNVLVNSWTLSNTNDVITGIGGNRYGWFDYNQFSTLAFDNAGLLLAPGNFLLTTSNPVLTNTPGTYPITYVATDPSGNSATNTRVVVVVDTIAPVITMLGANMLTNECHAVFVDPGFTALDSCSAILTLTTNNTVNTNVPGTYTNTYVATDPSGNSATNTRVVVVVDTIAPVITMLGANPFTNECHVAFVDPGFTALDACSALLTLTTNSTVNANVPGNYTNIYVAADSSGNATTNTRLVVIVDTTPATINCPSNLVVAVDLGQCSKSNVTFSTIATDACDTNSTVVCTPSSGSTFPVGVTTVSCVATDSSGNTNTCSFTVTVNDGENPVLSACPTNFVIYDTDGSGDEVVNFSAPTATDNCPGVMVICNPANGSVLGLGAHTVTCTATDAAGNSNSCSFIVVVCSTNQPIVYVDDNYTNLAIGTMVTFPNGAGSPTHSIGCDAFATIQGGENAVAAAGTVNVAAGTYAEQLTLNKVVHLVGPNAGMTGYAARGAEALIVPPSALNVSDSPKEWSAVPIINITADGVSMDGFKISGDNTLVAGYSYAGMNVCAGLAVHSTANNVQFLNNIVEKVTYTGFHSEGGQVSPHYTGLVVTRNLFDSIHDLNQLGYGYAMDIQGTAGTITDNKVTNTRTGMEIQPYQVVGSPTIVSNNNISVWRLGIYYNYAEVNASSWTITANQIASCLPPEAPTGPVVWEGIRAETMRASGNGGLIMSNTVDGTVALTDPTHAVWGGFAHAVWGLRYKGGASDSTNVFFTGNAVQNVSFGFVHDAPANIVLTGNSFSATDSDIRLQQDYTSTGTPLGSGGTGNIDATGGNTYEGVDSTTATLAQLFATEDKILHKVDNSVLGFVRVKAANVYVTTASGSIQRGIDAATAGDTVNVNDGIFDGKLSVTKAVKLLSANGSGSTTIKDTTVTGYAPIQLSGTTTGVEIGDVGRGFTILGIDGSPGIEYAAIYVQGIQTNTRIVGNNVVAAGDEALLTESGAAISGLVVTDNEFSGVTFTGPNPAGYGFANQFTTPNVPRQLVVIQSGAGPVTFSRNVVSGTAGGFNIASQQQGNTLVTIDAANATIQDNNFTGVSTRFATALRIGGANAVVTGNVFPGNTPGGLFVRSAAGATALVNYNSFTGYTAGWALESALASPLLNAVSNWWGSASGPVNSANPGATGVAVNANVAFSPWLGSGVDTSAAIGFQPNLAPVYYQPHHLVFSTQPGGTGINNPFAPQPVIQVINSNGGVATTFNGSVSLAINTGTAGAALSGTLTNSVINGVATFSGLQINLAGNYTLVAASASPILPAISSSLVISNSLPAITSLNPAWAVAGDAGFTLTVNGSNFVSDSVVRWNGADLATTHISTTQLSAPITALQIAVVSTASVTVFNVAPGGGESAATNFPIYGAPTVVYVDDDYSSSGANGGHLWGYDAFAAIQPGINRVTSFGTVNVAAGTYMEDVTISKTANVIGAGAGQSIVVGQIGGSSSTFQFGSSGIVLDGFTITRAGNNTNDWSNSGLNSAGVAMQGLTVSGTVRNCLITGMRTGIDINNASGITVRNNVINNNRTGLIMRNQTDSLTVVENEITDNWTVGLLFLDGSGGSNIPVQSASNCTFSSNNISGNWYGQIVDRQTGGSLPAPGANLKNFSGNWLGTNAPVVTNANSAEPGYAALIPVIFGGTATNPGSAPTLAGLAVANIDYTPWLDVGTDISTNVGFQGNFSTLHVDDNSPQTGSTGRVQEGVNMVSGSTVLIAPGTYLENVVITSHVNLDGAGNGSNPAVDSILTAANPALPVITVNDAGGSSTSVRLRIRALRVTGSSGDGIQVNSTSGTHSYYRFDTVASVANSGSGINFAGTTSITDVQVDGCVLNNNGNTGLRAASSLLQFDTVSVTGGEMKNNGVIGLGLNPSGLSSFNSDNITVDGTTFVGNGDTSTFGSGDLSFFGFNGSATLKNLSIAADGQFPIQFRGKGTASSGTWLTAGAISLENVVVTGAGARPGLYINRYSNVVGFSFTNVDLSTYIPPSLPSGFATVMQVEHSGVVPMDLGSLKLACAPTYGALAMLSTGGATATCGTVIVGANTPADQELCVFDQQDFAGVGDITFPTFVISCSAVPIVAECVGAAGRVVNYSVPVTSACDPSPTLTCTPASGSVFPIGNTTVNCVAVDSRGMSNTCSFIVKVQDTTPPAINCPTNLVLASDPNQCSKSGVAFASVATDICDASPTVVCTPPSGSTFPVGVTTVNCVATDSSGNSNSCSFTVTVLETVPPVITCPADVLVQCGQTAPGLTGFATAVDNCDTNPVVSYLDSTPLQVIATNLHGWALSTAGSPLTASATFVNGPATPPLGTGSLRLAIGSNGDGMAEARNTNYHGTLLSSLTELDYRSYRTADGSSGNQSVYLVLNIDLDGNGTVDDLLIFEPKFQNGSNPSLPLQGAISTGSWQSWDALAGGWSSQSGLAGLTPGAGVKSLAVYIAAFPNARIVNNLVGSGGVRLVTGALGAWDNFDGAVDFFTIGTNGVSRSSDFELTVGCIAPIARAWTALDDSGNLRTCSQAIRQVDTTAPVLTCSTNIVVGNATGQCSAVVNFTVTAIDGCDATPVLVCTPASGSTFQVGTTIVNCVTTDACGNTTNCSFTVTVNDTQAPSITCPVNLVLSADVGQCSRSNVTFTVTALDNCTNVTVVSTPASGSTFPVGLTTVTNVATDAAGNTNSCTFTVTVNDTQIPTMTCPTNMTVSCAGTNGTPVFFSATATDNCDPLVTVTCVPASGYLFPFGSNNVVCTAVDSSGNTNTCSFTVTVVEPEPTLTIQLQGTNVVISWPVSCGTYILEQKNDLDPIVLWSTTLEPVVVVGNQNTVTKPASITQEFFRLRY